MQHIPGNIKLILNVDWRFVVDEYLHNTLILHFLLTD